MIIKVFVPMTHDGFKGWIFNFVCPGNAKSVFHEKLLLLRNATVNKNLGFDEICDKKQVFIDVESGGLPFILDIGVSDKCFTLLDSLCYEHLPNTKYPENSC